MLLLDSTAPEERRAKALSDIESTLNSQGGTIESRHDWGPRTMAYEIRHRPDADYHLLQFNGSPALIEQLNRSLRIDDAVLRFRIIKLRPGTPPPPDIRPERRPDPTEADLAAPPDAAAPAEAVPAEVAAGEGAPAEAPPPEGLPAEAPAAEAAPTDAAPPGDAAAAPDGAPAPEGEPAA